MSDIVERLRGTVLDGDNFPRMDSERWFPVGLAKEAAAEIERLRAALAELLSGHDNLYVAHFGLTSNPHDDIAAKAARRALELADRRPVDGDSDAGAR